MKQAMIKEPTPLEKLISNKERIKVLSKIQENKMNANVQYVQQNGGKLLLTGVTSAVFPKTQSKITNKVSGSSSLPSAITGLALGGVADYFTKGKHILPLAFSVAQPFLLTWGIKGAKKLIGNLLSGKKKKKK